MLLTRIITALVLLPLVLGALFWFPDWGWGLFAVLLVGAASREWARLSQLPSAASFAFMCLQLVGMLMLLGTSLHDDWRMAYKASIVPVAAYVALVFWAIVAPLWLRAQYRATATVNAAAGAAVLLPTFVALLVLREASPWLLLSFAVLVWVADIAAYFAGRRFGRRKLAPAISPGKTLEGVAGGVVAVVLYYFLWRAAAAHWPMAWSTPWLAAGGMVLLLFVTLGLASVLGDLFESWIKRGAGMKDSGTLLPGHGGVLDRIDALTSALPLAMAYIVFAGAA
ncbi:MAG: phosphatidate cytidylyltransferase [Betaproteobacteria bacterium]|nr:phosphatidate cytidylyltransferase [Betaproteobacteria bacterium]